MTPLLSQSIERALTVLDAVFRGLDNDCSTAKGRALFTLSLGLFLSFVALMVGALFGALSAILWTLYTHGPLPFLVVGALWLAHWIWRGK